jgi:KUP system potassium uptake protein
MAPGWALYPLVALAAMATVIASQAVISGVFSLTRQAVLLGFAPRVEIIHTSPREIGQIYLPGANWALMIGTLALVLAFRSSSNLAAAYGVAVTTTMIVTTLLAFVAARRIWHWRLPVALAVTLGFLVADLAFFGANIVKIAQGGWLPLAIGLLGFFVFTTWRKGRQLLAAQIGKTALPIETFLQDLEHHRVTRVPGTAAFLNSSPDNTPIGLLHNLKLNHIIHEQNLIVTVVTDEVPYVPRTERLRVELLHAGFARAIIRYGFMQDPDVPSVLATAKIPHLALDPTDVTYILSDNTLIPTRGPGMSLWRKRLFAFLSRNALQPTQFFRLPVNRVIEIGMQIKL